VQEFEEKVASYCGARYAVAVSSGTAALHLACLAADIQRGDEVITSPLSFAASANCVVYCGGRPVFADIEESTGLINPNEVERRVTRRTKAIIPVHYGGLPCSMKELAAIARRRQLLIIEDAAQSLGAAYRTGSTSGASRRWTKVGGCRHSDMTILSFHPVKSITTGEGGMILTNQSDLANRLRRLRTHGIARDSRPRKGSWYYEMLDLGFNYRITDIQCALGLSQLRRLDRFIERRSAIATMYRGALQKLRDWVTLPFSPPAQSIRHAWHIFPMRLNLEMLRVDRGRIFDALIDEHIGVNVHHIPIHLHPYYRRTFGYREGDYPVAEQFYRRALTLPLFPRMLRTDVEDVVRAVHKVITYYGV
jgi:dTDP-4-amino-4,6-dideoxygalactose transaminase